MAIHDVGRDEGCNELIKDLNVSEDTDFNLKKKKLKQSTCDKNSIKLVLVVDVSPTKRELGQRKSWKSYCMQ